MKQEINSKRVSLCKFYRAVSDITYIKVNDDWIYLTKKIDLADREIVVWSLSKDMTYKNRVYKAWNIEISKREIKI